MARRRRRSQKPLLPGLGTVVICLLLVGSVSGLFWFLGRSLILERQLQIPGTATAAKRK